MQKKRALEIWTWVLIYGGLGLLSLGFFVQRSGASLGRALVLGGLLLAALGALLVVLRSRMREGQD